VIVSLTELDKDALVRIIKEPKNSLLKQYVRLLEMDGVNLTFDPEALEAIAAKAIQRNTGARGLRAIFEELMMEVMYDVPSHSNIAEVVITNDAVVGKSKPTYVYKEA
jgi:ATP-dependent Clp protease ATP-binding subunit ClpX